MKPCAIADFTWVLPQTMRLLQPNQIQLHLCLLLCLWCQFCTSVSCDVLFHLVFRFTCFERFAHFTILAVWLSFWTPTLCHPFVLVVPLMEPSSPFLSDLGWGLLSSPLSFDSGLGRVCYDLALCWCAVTHLVVWSKWHPSGIWAHLSVSILVLEGSVTTWLFSGVLLRT